MHLVIEKKKFFLSAHNYPWTRLSLWSSVLRDVATVKTLDIVWKHFWKKEEKRKNWRRRVLGKSQFCREKKNGKIKEEKKKQQKKSATREIWLSCAWCASNIGLNFQKTFIKKKKQMCLWFSSRTKKSSWIIKMCVNYFKTVFIDAYVPNIETTKSDNITESCSNQT